MNGSKLNSPHTAPSEWQTAQIDLAAISPELRRYLERCAQWTIKALQPRPLLLKMHVAQQDAVRYARERTTYLSVSGESTHSRGVDGLDFDQRVPYCYRYLEGHPGVHVARDRLHRVGVRTKYWDDSEYTWKAFHFGVFVSDETLAAVRALAKEDAGIRTDADSADYDRRFDLYFRQNYAPDWEVWRKREPLMDQP